MKTIYEKFKKEDISNLPRAVFEGRIFVITTESETKKAIDYLMKQPILGFDTETRPSFKHGVVHKVSLLQVSTRDTCFLFRIKDTGITDSIKQLLEDTHITKIGLSLHDDFMMLQKRRKFVPGTFIDLQNEVKELGIADCSLQKLYANIFGRLISKRQQLTNWDADILTEPQKLYAATDAWACIMLHEEIERLNKTNDYELILDVPDIPEIVEEQESQDNK